MKILKINLQKPTERVIRSAVKAILAGEIIVYPTDTAYALGGLALNQKVVTKVFQLKGRQDTKPLPVIVGSFGLVLKVAKFNQKALRLAKKYWPGPLTLVLPKTRLIPEKLVAGQRNIALRIPALKLARTLSQRVKAPLISTSANLSGQSNCFTVNQILDQFKTKKPDLILDAGKLPRSKMSTIVAIQDGQIKVLRPGATKINPRF